MNNPDLDRLLRSASVPEREPEYWENFPEQVRVRLNAPRRVTQAIRPSSRARLTWIVITTVCVALAFVFVGRRASPQRAESAAWVKSQTALREVLTLFPNRVRSILQDASGTHLVLSDQPDVPSSPPVWIEFEKGGQWNTAVTFSGQQIEIAGERVEVLANPQGQITLVGDRIFWSSVTAARSANGLRVRAGELPVVL